MEKRSQVWLDEEELGRTVQLLYDAFYSVESVGGSLSPYVPTQGDALETVEALASAIAARTAQRRLPVYYEPGCGAGRVAARMTARGLYTVCLELDEYLALEAARRLRGSPLGDVVVGDLSVFRPRRVDVAYAYLLPRAVSKALEALRGTGAALLSLDYPAEGDRGAVRLARLDAAGRSLYVYRA